MVPELVTAGLPLLAAWVWWIDRRVASHDALIPKLNQLVDLLLEERLADGRENRNAR